MVALNDTFNVGGSSGPYLHLISPLALIPSTNTILANMTDNITGQLTQGEQDISMEPEATAPKPLGPPLLNHSLPLVVALSVAYLVVFILAVVNNSLVVSIIYRNPQMRNVTNYFLANLAIADITVSVIVLPITLLSNIFTGKVHFYLYFVLFL